MQQYSPLINSPVDETHLAGGRHDVCLVFPFRVSNNISYGGVSGQYEASDYERRVMDRWKQKRIAIMKQLVAAGLDLKASYSRDKDEIFVKVGTDQNKLQDIAEMLQYKLKIKDDYCCGYAPYKKDFQGTAANQYKDRQIVSNIYDTPNNNNDYTTEQFKTSDRIALIDHIIRGTERGCANIDIGGFMKSGDLRGYFPLHESRKIEAFDRDWISSFLFTSNIDYVREYFGDRVAYYFSFMNFFTKWLCILALFGGVFFAISSLYDTTNNVGTPTFCIIVSIWAILFTHFWRRKANLLSVRWGTFDKETIEEPFRNEFYGERKVSPITGQPEMYYPWSDRVWYVIGSCITIVISMCACLFATFFVYMIRHALHDVVPGGRVTFMILLAICVDAFNNIFSSLAFALTQKENYATQTQFDNALLAKTLLFKIVNSYGALFYIIFFKEGSNVMGFEMHCYKNDCLYDMSLQLIVFVFYQLFVSNFFEFIVPKVRLAWLSWRESKTYNSVSPDGNGRLLDLSAAERQMKLTEYNPFGEFDEMAVQYGYVALFSVALPWLPIVTLLANVVEVYIDKSKLLHLTRRPFPIRTKHSEVWNASFEFMGLLAVFTNIAIVLFTSKEYQSLTTIQKLTWFLILEHAIIGLRLLVALVLPSVSETAYILYLKNKYFVSHKFGFASEDDGAVRAVSQGREMDIPINDIDEDDD